MHRSRKSSIAAICLLVAALAVVLSAGTAQQYPSDARYDDVNSVYRQQPQLGEPTLFEEADTSPQGLPPGPTFRPFPVYPAPPAEDPSVAFVPRMGSVRGVLNYRTAKDRGINAFLGLKYGEVGPGIKRFQKATKPQYYGNGVIDATHEPENCPQFPDLNKLTERAARGENIDDCLTLNVYAPNRTGLFPVMVFIHGEMLFDGSAEEGQPDYFLEHDIVLVTVNYRLAPFGFLTTLSDDLPGNVALADIQLALEWINNFIQAFHGNHEQVTIFGQAGGAVLVHALSLSDKATGLFHKVILQSGTALSPYFLDEDPLSTARNFARYARCPGITKDLEYLRDCFARQSTVEFLQIFKRHWENNEPRVLRLTGGFKLVVGDKLGYLPQHPAALLANHSYPLIAGVTKDAGAFIMSRFYDQLQEVQSRNISDYINVVLKHTTHARHHIVWKNWALQHIFTAEDVQNPSLEKLAQGLLELTNLILYRGPIIDSIRMSYKKNPTYLYCFDYRGEFHRFGHLTNPLPFEIDATLSDDNIYLFPYPEEVSRLNPQDKTIARTLTTMWVDFAYSSIPNRNPGIWPNVSSEYGPFLRITNSKESALELDYHFGEGIPVPNLYSEYFVLTTNSTTTTTTRRPYPNYENRPPYYQQPQQMPPRQPWRPHETVLNDPRTPPYPYNYASNYEQNNLNVNGHNQMNHFNYPARS